MPAFTSPPKFDKRSHHVVPVSWQFRFAAPGDIGPYYRNVITGTNLNAQGPGKKMAEEYANIVFDEHFRPSDALEDKLGCIESKAIQGLDQAISASAIDCSARIDIAYLLAIQACRYPECFQQRLDIGRYLAIVLQNHAGDCGAAALNTELQLTGMLPGASFSAEDVDRLNTASKEDLIEELDLILTAHGCEAFFNPELVVAAAMPVAEHLLALEWELFESVVPAFILSDRPVPKQIGYDFNVGLSARLGLRLSKPTRKLDNLPIVARTASTSEIQTINKNIRARAHEWICGPGSWVHTL